MHLPINKIVFLLFACALSAHEIPAGVPISGEAHSVTIRPAIFLLEDYDGGASRVTEWVKLSCTRYYLEAISSLKQEVANKKAKGYSSAQTEKLLSIVEVDAAHALIPRWTENIFIVCRKSEVIVSLFPRSGGWSKASNGSLVALSSPAYVCTIDPATGTVRTGPDDLKAVVFANLYSELGKAGISTDFAENTGFVAPLNK